MVEEIYVKTRKQRNASRLNFDSKKKKKKKSTISFSFSRFFSFYFAHFDAFDRGIGVSINFSIDGPRRGRRERNN